MENEIFKKVLKTFIPLAVAAITVLSLSACGYEEDAYAFKNVLIKSKTGIKNFITENQHHDN